MVSSTYNFAEQQQHLGPAAGVDASSSGANANSDGGFDDDPNQSKSSLSKTFGNVMNMVNDGLYRIKNRAKAELVAFLSAGRNHLRIRLD